MTDVMMAAAVDTGTGSTQERGATWTSPNSSAFAWPFGSHTRRLFQKQYLSPGLMPPGSSSSLHAWRIGPHPLPGPA